MASSGIVVDRARSGKWRYRVLDRQTGRYRCRSFARGDDEDGRRKPGCRAGDEWAAETAARYALGQDSAASLTMAELGRRYAAHRQTQGDSAGYVRNIANAVRIAVDEAGVTDLSDRRTTERLQSAIAAHQARRRGQREARPATPRTRNAQIAIWQAMGRWAVRRQLIGRDPFAALERFREPRRLRQVYALAELRAMVSDAHRDDPWWPFVVLATYTGARSATLRAMTWGMVNWERERIDLPAEVMKARADSRIPLQPELAAILREWGPGQASACILPPAIASATSDACNVRTQRYLHAVGVDPAGRSVHCIRHSVAGLLVATGLSPFLVMDAMSHSNMATSKHYATYAAEYRDQVRGWQEGVFRLREDGGEAGGRRGECGH
jgi:site-specific recombinase XerD